MYGMCLRCDKPSRIRVYYKGDGMTEKRFTETLSTGIVTDNITGKEYNCEMRIDEELLDLLNELDERYVDEFCLRETLQQELQRIEKENETIPNIIEIMEVNIQLKEENEQLKHELHTLTGLYAFDKLGDGVKASEDVITIPRKDLIKLDYGDV